MWCCYYKAGTNKSRNNISTGPYFPIVNIKRQLQQLYNKKGFEESCRKWAARPNNDHELSDIYDGRIWKEFKDPNEDRLFFRHDASDSNLGIDRKSTRLNSSHSQISYAVFCL